MKLTQQQLKQLAEKDLLTPNTTLYAGMHIYTILKASEDGAIVRKGYNLIAEDILLEPTEKDWDGWTKDPQNENRSHWDTANNGTYLTCADVNDLSERAVMSEKEIIDFELEKPREGIFVTHD